MVLFKLFTILLVIAAMLYYIVCLLEIFRVIKFTPAHMSIESPKFLIPFYYFFKKK
jgi:hypothetical protein